MLTVEQEKAMKALYEYMEKAIILHNIVNPEFPLTMEEVIERLSKPQKQ